MINEQLVNLSDDFFQNSLDASPTSAIMRGHKAYFDKIEELTEEQFEIDSKNTNRWDNLFLARRPACWRRSERERERKDKRRRRGGKGKEMESNGERRKPRRVHLERNKLVPG